LIYEFDLLITINFYVSIRLGKYVNFLSVSKKTAIDKVIDIRSPPSLSTLSQTINSCEAKTLTFVGISYFIYF